MERRANSPVEAVVRSLLSTTPLRVAAAQDMDLKNCIEYLLRSCVDGEGKLAAKFAEMSVGNLLRENSNQYKLIPSDLPDLRARTTKCLEVRGGGDSQPGPEEGDSGYP